MARIEEFLVANMPSHLHNDVSRAGAGALERLKCSTTRSTSTTSTTTTTTVSLYYWSVARYRLPLRAFQKAKRFSGFTA